jgi:hypothetical protein
MAHNQISRHRAVDLVASFPDVELPIGPNRTARWLSESGALALRFLHFPQAIVNRASRLVVIVHPLNGRIEAVLRGAKALRFRAFGAGVLNPPHCIFYRIPFETAPLDDFLHLL